MGLAELDQFLDAAPAPRGLAALDAFLKTPAAAPRPGIVSSLWPSIRSFFERAGERAGRGMVEPFEAAVRPPEARALTPREELAAAEPGATGFEQFPEGLPHIGRAAQASATFGLPIFSAGYGATKALMEPILRRLPEHLPVPPIPVEGFEAGAPGGPTVPSTPLPLRSAMLEAAGLAGGGALEKMVRGGVRALLPVRRTPGEVVPAPAVPPGEETFPPRPLRPAPARPSEAVAPEALPPPPEAAAAKRPQREPRPGDRFIDDIAARHPEMEGVMEQDLRAAAGELATQVGGPEEAVSSATALGERVLEASPKGIRPFPSPEAPSQEWKDLPLHLKSKDPTALRIDEVAEMVGVPVQELPDLLKGATRRIRDPKMIARMQAALRRYADEGFERGTKGGKGLDLDQLKEKILAVLRQRRMYDVQAAEALAAGGAGAPQDALRELEDWFAQQAAEGRLPAGPEELPDPAMAGARAERERLVVSGGAPAGPAQVRLPPPPPGRGPGLISRMADDIRSWLAPGSRGAAAAETKAITREQAALLAQKSERARFAMKGLEHDFEREAAEMARTFPQLTGQQRTDAWLRTRIGRITNFIEQGWMAQLPPEDLAAARVLRGLYQQREATLRTLGTGALRHFIQDYMGHMWRQTEEAADVFARIYAKRPLAGTKGFLKKRTIPSTLDGIRLGLEPVDWNPVRLELLKLYEMDRYVLGQNIFSELRDAGLTQFVRGGRRPPGYAKVNDSIVRRFQWSEAERGFIQRGEYFVPEPAARILNNYLSPGLNRYAAYQAYRYVGNILNQAQLGLSSFHFVFTGLDTFASQLGIGLQRTVRGEPIKSLQAFARVPVAPFRAYVRGSKVLKEYMAPGSQGAEFAKIVDEVVKGGGRVRMESLYKNSSVERFWQALGARQPVRAGLHAFPALLETTMKPLMEHWVPRVKLGVFADLAEMELAKLPATAGPREVRQVLGRVWDSVDNRLGQLVYDNLFWNRTLKDIGLASVRALGWNIGSVRELGGGFLDVAKIRKAATAPGLDISPRTAYLLSLPVVAGTLGSVIHYLYTGKAPETITDMYYPRTGRVRADASEDRLSIPSYMRDVVSYAKAPLATAVHKLHPEAGVLYDLFWSNRDFYGGAIRNEEDPAVRQLADGFKYALSRFEPFSLQSAEQAIRAGIPPAEAIIQGLAGLTQAPASITRSAEQQRSFELKQNLPALRRKYRRESQPGLLDDILRAIQAP